MSAKRRRSAEIMSEVETVASATECTGLMPALPQDEAQDESSAALYAIHDGTGTVDGRRRKG